MYVALRCACLCPCDFLQELHGPSKTSRFTPTNLHSQVAWQSNPLGDTDGFLRDGQEMSSCSEKNRDRPKLIADSVRQTQFAVKMLGWASRKPYVEGDMFQYMFHLPWWANAEVLLLGLAANCLSLGRFENYTMLIIRICGNLYLLYLAAAILALSSRCECEAPWSQYCTGHGDHSPSGKPLRAGWEDISTHYQLMGAGSTNNVCFRLLN